LGVWVGGTYMTIEWAWESSLWQWNKIFIWACKLRGKWLRPQFEIVNQLVLVGKSKQRYIGFILWLMPRSHQTFRSIPTVKLLGIMFINRFCPTTFHTITAGDAHIAANVISPSVYAQEGSFSVIRFSLPSGLRLWSTCILSSPPHIATSMPTFLPKSTWCTLRFNKSDLVLLKFLVPGSQSKPINCKKKMYLIVLIIWLRLRALQLSFRHCFRSLNSALISIYKKIPTLLCTLSTVHKWLGYCD